MTKAAVIVNRRPFLSDLVKWITESGARVKVVIPRSLAASQLENCDLLKRACCGVCVVDDYDDERVEEVIFSACVDVDADVLLSTTETDVIRCAKVRERLAIPGQSLASATAYRDKWVMKSIASAAGIKVARMARFGDKKQLVQLETSNSPFVVKPISGAASIGVQLVTSFSAAVSVLRDKHNADDYLVEEFVSHKMFHVDGLMLDGFVLQAWPSMYLYNNLLSLYESKPLITGQLEHHNPLTDQLLKSNATVIASLPVAAGMHAFHAEYFLTSRNEIVLCEIASRAGGAGTAEVYEKSFGVSQYEEPIRYGLGGLRKPVYSAKPRTRHGYGWFMPLRGVVKRTPGKCDIDGTVRFFSRVQVGSVTNPPSFSTEAIAETVFLMGDGEELSRLQEFELWWKNSTEWAE